MDKIDRDNLQFILNTKGKELEEWHNGLTEDEKLYAFNLLQSYKEELNYKSILLSNLPITNLSDAKIVLSRFTLVK